MLDFAIDKLNELLIKQTFEDKKKGTDTYVKKTRCYRDLIKLLKEYRSISNGNGANLRKKE